MARANTGKSFTDATVTAELANAEAATADAVAQTARADAGADRVEANEDDAFHHAQATAPFESLVDGLTYPKGAKGWALGAAADAIAADTSAGAAASSEASASAAAAAAAASEAVAAAVAGGLALVAGGVDGKEETYGDLPSPDGTRGVYWAYTEGTLWSDVAGVWTYAGTTGSGLSASTPSALASRRGGPGATVSTSGARPGTGATWDWQATNPYPASTAAEGYLSVATTGGRWVLRLPNGRVDETMFGATGLGVADDLPAFQRLWAFATLYGHDVHYTAPEVCYRVTGRLDEGLSWMDPEDFDGLDFLSGEDYAAARVAYNNRRGMASTDPNYVGDPLSSESRRRVNAASYRPNVTTAGEAVVFWADFAAATTTPVISYNFGQPSDGERTPNFGGTHGPVTVVGRTAFEVTGGVCSWVEPGAINGPGCPDGDCNLVGLFVPGAHGLRVHGFSADRIREGFLSPDLYWARIEGGSVQQTERAYRALTCNATKFVDTTSWYSDVGYTLQASGGGGTDNGSSQNCRVDMRVNGNAFVIQGGYLEYGPGVPEQPGADDYSIELNGSPFPAHPCVHGTLINVYSNRPGNNKGILLSNARAMVYQNVRTIAGTVDVVPATTNTGTVIEGDIWDRLDAAAQATHHRIVGGLSLVQGDIEVDSVHNVNGVRIGATNGAAIKRSDYVSAAAPGGSLAAGAATHYDIPFPGAVAGSGRADVFHGATYPDGLMHQATVLTDKIRVQYLNMTGSSIPLTSPVFYWMVTF
jgi:hypothetical protein